MSRREWKRLEAIERVMSGAWTTSRAGQVLGLSKRQVRRLRRAMESRGAAGLIHGNKGRVPGCRASDETRERVVTLMKTTYAGFNDQHFTEKLGEVEGIELSRPTVRRILRSAGVVAVRKRRPRQYRGRRERRAQAGLMLLWDGSLHAWLEERGPSFCLMAAIDDATGDIMPGAHFVEHESTAGYLRVLLEVAKKHGLPWSIYMDRHGSLKRNDDHWTVEEELRGEQDLTEVGRALRELEIETIYALSPEAKGRIERLWGTLQDRLVSELRLAGARTKDEANAVLAALSPQHNARFGRPAQNPEPAWRPVPARTDLAAVCSFRRQATVGRNNTVQFEGQVFDIPAGPRNRSYAGRRADLRLLLDGELRIYIDGNCLVTASLEAPKTAPTRRTKRAPPKGRPSGPRKLTFKEIVAKVRTTTTGRTESLNC